MTLHYSNVDSRGLFFTGSNDTTVGDDDDVTHRDYNLAHSDDVPAYMGISITSITYVIYRRTFLDFFNQ